MAWKCPKCETLNQDPNCVVCGAAKPAGVDEIKTAEDYDTVGKISAETYDAAVSKKQPPRIIIIIAVAALCVISALIGFALSNPDDQPVSGVTDLPAVTRPQSETGVETKPETETEPVIQTETGTGEITFDGDILSVSLNTNTLTLKIGQSSKLTGTIEHTGTKADDSVTWSSSDTGVAAVASDGTVTAKGKGTAVISIFTSNKKTASCTVTVTAVEVTGVSVSAVSVTLILGGKYTLTATLLPADAADATLAWTTSDAGVVNCSGGILTATGTGRATVTVRTTNGKSAVCAVYVTAGAIEAASVTLDQSVRTVKAGESFTLSAEVLPSDTTDKNITWTSSDITVAECENGRVTAQAAGETIITVKTANGKTAVCTVTVTGIDAESVTLSDVKLTLNIGDVYTLTAAVLPSETTDKTLIWESGDNNIVSCDNGALTAKASGTVNITVRVSNGREAVCNVTVVPVAIPAMSVALDVSTLTLEPGDLYTFTVTVDPEEAAGTDLTWVTDNPGAVNIVGSNGGILAVADGSAVITVMTANGKNASCSVTVKTAEPETNTESDFSYNISGTGAVITGYTGTSTDVIIPDMLGGLPVTAIADSAFYNKNITGVKIPQSVLTIGNFAFAYCTLLDSIIINEGTESIGDYAFAGCAMTQFALPSTVVYIGEGAFGQCSNLSALTLSASNPDFCVSDGVLYDKGMTKLVCFPAGLQSISSVLPLTLTEIGPSAFFGCLNLSTIVIPSGVTTLGNQAFAYCGSMIEVVLPSGLNDIGTDAFSYCDSLESISIPSGVARIEERTFIGCSRLSSAVITEGVTYIADNAFDGCTSLVITCPAGSYAEQYASDKGIGLKAGGE